MSASRWESPTPNRLTVLYDAGCGLCELVAEALHRLDAHHRLDLRPLQAEPEGHRSRAELLDSLHVVDAGGRWHRGGAACLRIAEAVPLLRPTAIVLRLPVLRRLVEPLYELVARRRHRLSRLLGMRACRRPPAHR